MKRYEKYKNSGVQWIGKVPEHWVISRLKYFCEPLKSGGTPKSDDSRFYAAEGIPWVAIADMSSTPLVIDTAKHLTEEGIADKNLNIFPSGTILYSIYATLGKVSELAVPACINQAILAINPDKRYCKTYFKYCLTAQEQYVYSLSNGNTQNNLNAEKVANFFMALPPLSEQKAIASFLDAKTKPIDDIIAKREKQIELLEEMKSAIISRAVTKGLNPDVKMKGSGIEWIGEIPEEWELRKLKYILKSEKYNIKTGPFGTQLKGNDLREEGEIPVYNQRNVIDNQFNAPTLFVTLDKAKELAGFHTKPNDVLITSRGTIGKAAILPDSVKEGVLHPCLIALRINQDLVTLKYLLYYINGFEGFAINVFLESNATTIEVIYTDTLKNIFVTLPQLEEQKQIVSYLDTETSKIDSRIAKRRKQIELLQEYKQALITAAVTGKIDVRDYIS